MEISKNSRVWIYQSNRPFSVNEETQILSLLSEFTGQWAAHGQQLTARADLRYHRFIILMVDEAQAGASGCSIDKSVNLMKQIEQEFNVSLFDRFHIAYREGDKIESYSRDDFEKLITEGKITEKTIVFNNLVQTVDELNTKWEVPFNESWHAQVFSLVNT